MKACYAVVLALLAGIGMGALGLHGLQAQQASGRTAGAHSAGCCSIDTWRLSLSLSLCRPQPQSVAAVPVKIINPRRLVAERAALSRPTS